METGPLPCVTTAASPSSPGWHDITAEFKAACSSLSVGELCRDEGFSLYEAMSSIEMMDPKMDAGLSVGQRGHHQGAPEEKVWHPLKPVDLLKVMSGTLRCFVTWLDGHSLAQTVFINTYFHKPDAIPDISLRAFSLTILKTVHLVRDLFNKTLVFEEEDFQPLTHGLHLADDVPLSRVVALIREADEELAKKTRHARQQRDACIAGTPEAKTELDKLMVEYEVWAGLHTHIRLSRTLLSIMALVKSSSDAVKKPFSDINAVPNVKTFDLADLQKMLPKFGEIVDCLNKIDFDWLNDDVPSIPGFDPMCTHRLLPPSFPRHTPIKSRPQCMEFFKDLFTHLTGTCELVKAAPALPTHDMLRALDFFVEFSQRGPNILPRSLLIHAYLPQSPQIHGLPSVGISQRVYGHLPTVDAAKEAARLFISPPALTPGSSLKNILATNENLKALVMGFLGTAARPLCALFTVASNNRARQRDKLGMLLEDLSTLQMEADKVDSVLDRYLRVPETSLQRQAFSAWVLFYVAQTMIQYLLLGFELELYAVHEYCYIFCYLSEVLYLWLISALVRADGCIAEQREGVGGADSKSSAGSAATNRKKANKQRARRGKSSNSSTGASSGATPIPHTHRTVMARVCQQLCAAYYHLLTALYMNGALRSSNYELDREEVRYAHRFAAFSSVGTPAPMRYSHFRELARRSERPCGERAQVLAKEAFRTACMCFEKTLVMLELVSGEASEETKAFTRLAKMNLVAGKVLGSEYMRGVVRMPTFEFSLSPFFPLIKL